VAIINNNIIQGRDLDFSQLGASFVCKLSFLKAILPGHYCIHGTYPVAKCSA
jgi:hypothetical protein